MTAYDHIPLEGFENLSSDEMQNHSKTFLEHIKRRRTVRDFSDEAIHEDVIKNCILAAGSAPSGANMQPWHYVAVQNPAVKKQIREGAEAEEREFYQRRASEEWLDALAPLGTDANKPFLETAPWLIVVFASKHTMTPEGEKKKHYYVPESVGISTGMLITALHNCGLATLTHTPSPMKFLNEILDRPVHEKPYMIIVAGKPAEGVTVPNITKKSFDEFAEVV
ncbi:nitroreductase family protein [Endozoicomonas sp. OPT23]|uniref:nitroreductase family protein n=1 Tax=Endozoicomonas sp. OPT23 TaxID=2072845 RepID=UPI00129B5998|nr:nitroreductase family protein [Endozoicomonas sp. OPT23]MRI33243.1 nitroreductase family protein [Endozoicomonas sp. OPT23]